MKQNVRPSLGDQERIIRAAILMPDLTRQSLAVLMRNELRDGANGFPSVIDLWVAYRKLVDSKAIKPYPHLERVLRVKDVRTDSGVAPITVLTKPYPCPGKCVYCPTEVRMPKSYISSEPAAARALSLKFDPYEQVFQRVQTLEKNGHDATKIELIVKGGTWSSYRWDYREWFIKRCFDAANHLGQKKVREFSTLRASQDANEKAKHRIIGLTIETRPDWVNAQEVVRLRELGCTRVELGVQTLRDEILDLTQRGHHVDATIRAFALLKQAGFKVDAHMLPGQPGSTPETDVDDMRRLFADADFRPDMIKLYPCVVLPTAELHAWSKAGKFTPIEGNDLKELLIKLQALVPRYCRISRLIRDFPEHEISYGNKVTNLREQLETEMKKRGTPCQCLRCREIGHVTDVDPDKITPQLFEEWYEQADGTECFLSMEDPDRKAVFAFCRVRFPTPPKPTNDPKRDREAQKIVEALPELRDTAIVRELHTYGTALGLKQGSSHASQHKGYGKLLMKHAEKLAKQKDYSKIAVISGIGVREYYRSLGYAKRGTYMIKKV